MSDSPNLILPFLEAAQAQKHVTVNDALLALDAVVQLAVLDRDLAAPPASPADGERYLVASSATGDWAGKDGTIAARQDGVWNFHAPKPGWRAWIGDEAALVVYNGASWTPVSGGGGGGGAVSAVFGRTGAVTAAASDYDAAQVDFSPAGGVAASDVQAAIEELDSEKAAASHDHDGDYQPLGAVAGVNAQTGSSYTLALGDVGKLVTMNNAGGNLVTVPGNSSVAFPVNCEIAVMQLGAGATSIGPAGGVTISFSDGTSLSGSGSKRLLNRYAGAALVKTGTNAWWCPGAII